MALSSPVAHLWPDFTQKGKSATIEDVLRHQARLRQSKEVLPCQEIFTSNKSEEFLVRRMTEHRFAVGLVGGCKCQR